MLVVQVAMYRYRAFSKCKRCTLGYAIKALSGVLASALVIATLTLSGCSGFAGVSFPTVTSQTSVGEIHGSVFGGHAPIVNSHVFLLEATASGTASTGYATMARPLITAASAGAAAGNGYPVTQDQVTGSATYGLYYITSNAFGEFYITGDYTCDIGYPVYLYVSGGSANSSFTIAITGISESLNHGTYTYTFTGNNLLSPGQTVQFSSLGGQWATLSGTTQTVLGTPTASSFQISTSIAPGSGSNVQTGTAISVGANNPAVVEVALLGICPSSGNFSSGPGALSYVYVNEVSTVAQGYALAGFASDPLHIGTSATNLVGLQNAALNSASLYNIQGAVLGAQQGGDGHIANLSTAAGNGTVPQAELDTLANILAACVDSANTATTPSATCKTLFADATSDGTSNGTKPIDIATAVINIAQNPGASHVLRLWNLAGGTVPFSPSLKSQPKDFTVAITYNNISSPGSLAIDSLGNALVPTNSSSGYVTKLSPAGAVLATSATGGNSFNSVAIDSGNNVFVTAANSNALYGYTSSLGSVGGSPWTSPQMNYPTSVVIDSRSHGNYVYVTDGGAGTQIIQKFNNSATSSPTVSVKSSISNSCLQHVAFIALDPSDYLWAATDSGNSVCRVSNPGGTGSFSPAGANGPTNVAIDSFGAGWVGAGAQTNLFRVTSGGAQTTYGVSDNDALGGLSSPSWVAIDGGNNVWITNAGNSYALSEFDSTGAAVTGSYGYQRGTLNNPSFIAIDASGDVWVPNQNSDSVTELIGAATPTVTPLSALQPGVRP
ncbi:MAG TPA: NHL repeat-containing protein [Acidobacteriaceae bacterium]